MPQSFDHSVCRWKLEPLPHPASHTMGQRVADSYVLINLETDRVFELNDTGARVWELLAECGDFLSLLNCLKQEFLVDNQFYEDEVRELIRSLFREGLIVDS